MTEKPPSEIEDLKAAVLVGIIQGLREAANIASRYNVNRGSGSATARAITNAIMEEARSIEPPPTKASSDT